MASELHDQLVQRAARWLRTTVGCRLVLTEARCNWCWEQPDAIGWKGVESYVVEVKVSRSDFLRDRKKVHARTGRGLGLYRYYLTPAALLKPADIPEGWGLLELHVDKVRNMAGPSVRNQWGSYQMPKPPRNEGRNMDGEVGLLISAAQGVSATMIRNLTAEASP